MMRKILIIAFLVSQSQLQAQGLQATVDYKMFYAPGKGNFVEIYSSFNPTSSVLAPRDSGLQSSIEVLYIIRKENKIVDYRKKNILSPVFTDSMFADFIDQDRLLLETGVHELEVQFTDLNKTPLSPVRSILNFDVEDLGKKVNISGIQLLEQYVKAEKVTAETKAGYLLVPYIINYYPTDVDKIAFYAEVYMSENARSKNESLILYQYVEDASTSKQIENMGKFQKLNTQEVTTVLNAFDITFLPTGEYNLVIEIKNKNKEVVAKRVQAFQRSNSVVMISDEMIAKSSIQGTFVEHYNNDDSLTDFIASLRPIGKNVETSVIDRYAKSNDIVSKKQFFYSFWLSRDEKNPETAWLLYKAEVRKANKFFSTRIKKGYDTERGRVYLKYGPPNQIVDRPSEPSAYPYQIWHYYKAANFSNKRFVFYMPDLGTNDYDLLHSDVTGEYKNYRWEYVLHSRNSTNSNIDAPGGDNQNHYGGQSTDFYRFPR